MDDSLAEKRREWDLIDLRGREFLRLLRRADEEGLLPELLLICKTPELLHRHANEATSASN